MEVEDTEEHCNSVVREFTKDLEKLLKKHPDLRRGKVEVAGENLIAVVYADKEYLFPVLLFTSPKLCSDLGITKCVVEGPDPRLVQ